MECSCRLHHPFAGLWQRRRRLGPCRRYRGYRLRGRSWFGRLTFGRGVLCLAIEGLACEGRESMGRRRNSRRRRVNGKEGRSYCCITFFVIGRRWFLAFGDVG